MPRSLWRRVGTDLEQSERGWTPPTAHGRADQPRRWRRHRTASCWMNGVGSWAMDWQVQLRYVVTRWRQSPACLHASFRAVTLTAREIDNSRQYKKYLIYFAFIFQRDTPNPVGPECTSRCTGLVGIMSGVTETLLQLTEFLYCSLRKTLVPSSPPETVRCHWQIPGRTLTCGDVDA